MWPTAGYLTCWAKTSRCFTDCLVPASCLAEEHRSGGGDQPILVSELKVVVAGSVRWLSCLFIRSLVLADTWPRGATGVVGYSEFTPPSCPPFYHPPPPHRTWLVSRMKLASCPGPGLLFKSRSVGPQAFHGFNVATHGNCST